MSQVIFAKSSHGIALVGDTLISHTIPGIAFPTQFTKVFKIDSYLFGVCGISQLQQMILNGWVEIGKGMSPAQIETYILNEYADYCSGKNDPQIPALVATAVRKMLWNPSLLVIRPNNEVILYTDWSTSFTGSLHGIVQTSDVIVMGPDVNYEPQVERRIKAKLPRVASLQDLAIELEKEIAQTASRYASSVGLPTVGFTKDVSKVITRVCQPSALSIQVTYGQPPGVVTTCLADWAEP